MIRPPFHNQPPSSSSVLPSFLLVNPPLNSLIHHPTTQHPNKRPQPRPVHDDGALHLHPHDVRLRGADRAGPRQDGHEDGLGLAARAGGDAGEGGEPGDDGRQGKLRRLFVCRCFTRLFSPLPPASTYTHASQNRNPTLTNRAAAPPSKPPWQPRAGAGAAG